MSHDTDGQYRLAFDPNGGSDAPEAQVSGPDGSFTIPWKVPVMDRYRFCGWARERYAGYPEFRPGEMIPAEGDMELYAIYSPVGNLTVLTDPGLDDAAAILEILAHRELFDSITFIAVGGNMGADQTLENLRKLIAASGTTDVTIVSTSDVPQNHGDADLIHGRDGMGDMGLPDTDIPFLTFEEWIGSTGDIDHLLSLGGFTVCRMILEKVEVGRFIAMGGFVESYPFYPDGEFNQRMDFEAFDRCVSRDHRIVTIDSGDLSYRTDVSGWTFEGDGLMDNVLNTFLRNCQAAGDTTIAVWDHIAVLDLLHPNMFDICVGTDRFGNRLNQLVLKGDYLILDRGRNDFRTSIRQDISGE